MLEKFRQYGFLPVAICLILLYVSVLEIRKEDNLLVGMEPEAIDTSGDVWQEAPDIIGRLNQATYEELLQIEGIGKGLADRILEKREQLQGFAVTEQLYEVEGIGKARFESVIEYFSKE